MGQAGPEWANLGQNGPDLPVASVAVLSRTAERIGLERATLLRCFEVYEAGESWCAGLRNRCLFDRGAAENAWAWA